MIYFNAFVYVQSPNALYQAFSINAILLGAYDGELTIKDLKDQVILVLVH